MTIQRIQYIFITVLLISTFTLPTFADKKEDAALEKKVEATLKKMSVEEKFDLIGEYKGYSIRPMEKFGIPEIKMSDASMGVRNYEPSTQYAASSVGAATWNRRIMYGVGTSLALDSKARGVGIILGPGLNIMRAPVCGRNFEYFSEDPYLTAEMGVNFINGLQVNGIAATAKHFALNNMEWGRTRIDSRSDERTMHEIYFPAFRAAVEQAHVACVMDAYNLVGGAYATENNWLNNKVLRGQWKFDGIVMSDWAATHSTVKAANAGLDLDMDGKEVANYFNRDSLGKAVSNGEITMETIDTKVRNILRIIYRFGFDKQNKDNEAKLLNAPQSSSTALREAEEGIVLLKNKDNILPLKKVQKLMVMGPFIDKNVRGGGSSAVTSNHYTVLASSLKQEMPSVKFITSKSSDIVPCTNLYQERNGTNPGLKVDYFNNSNMGGKPLFSETVSGLNYNWGKSSPNAELLGNDNFSMRYTGYLRVPKDGEYTLVLNSDEGSRMWLDDDIIIDNFGDPTGCKEFTVSLTANKDYAVKIEYAESFDDAHLMLCYRVAEGSTFEKDLKSCDAVILTAGFGEEIETEGCDRPWELPADQVALIKECAAVNPNTIVVLYTGGAVDVTSWMNDVKGIIWAGYPGQEGGTALANIMTGKVNPSGHLTATWAKRWEDYSCANNFYEKPGETVLNYEEGLLVGYRSFDKKNIEPVFPFGFGLSYTTFKLSNLQVKRDEKTCRVKVDVTNTGKVAGAEVIQVYVAPETTEAGEPVQTLRGFDKITLSPGQKKSITITLDKDAFSTYKVPLKKFTVNPGNYTVKVGDSSRNLPLKASVNVKKEKPRVVMQEN